MECVRNTVYLNIDNEDDFNDLSKPFVNIEDQIHQITKESNIGDEDFIGICRLCAQLIKRDTAVNIFNTLDLLQKINYALPVTVTFGDGLPNFICHQCENKLSAFHKFVCDVVKADKQLRTTLTSPDDNVTKTIEEIFGADSDDEDYKPSVPVKRAILDNEEAKKHKIEPLVLDSDGHKYACQRCREYFFEFSALLDHYKVLHGGTNLPCPEIGCSRTTKNEKLLHEHIRTCHGVPVICYKCGKIFLNQDVLIKHQRNKHSSKVCGFCWMAFETDAGYHAHMHDHRNSNQQQCRFCFKVYQTPRGLKKHTLNNHSSEITSLMEDNSADEL